MIGNKYANINDVNQLNMNKLPQCNFVKKITM